MYNLAHFKVRDPMKIMTFMKEHSFVTLCGVDADGKPVATHVPVFVDQREGELILSGHIMKSTDHHLAFENNAQVMAIFHGPHAYISASWYTKPDQASTWNYMTVHASGTIRFTDHASLLEILRRTTDHYENNPDSPAGFSKMPEEYVERLSRAIVAFELRVEQIEHVFKLSQNRDDMSFQHIIAHLEDGDADARAIAHHMRENRD
jgi:transcriptional regulator